MHFCRGENDEEDTQCCFFTRGQRKFGQTGKTSNGGCCGLSNSKNYQKKLQEPLKETRMVSDSQRNHKSNEKGKLSLSKLSNKKINHSRENFGVRQVTSNIGGSHAEAPKSRINENNQISFAVQSNPRSNFPMPQNFNIPSSTQLNIPRQFICNQKIYQKQLPIANFTYHPPENHRVGQNIIHYEKNNSYHPQVNFLQPQKKIQQKLTNSVNIKNLRVSSRRSSMQKNLAQDQALTASKKMETSTNSKKIQPLRIGLSINPPAPENEQAIQYSKLDEAQVVASMTGSPTRNFEESYMRQQSSFAGSRFTQARAPLLALGKQHLKTVQSIYGSEMGNKKQIQQSVILIDFFNPTEQRKRQIQHNITNMPFSDYRF